MSAGAGQHTVSGETSGQRCALHLTLDLPPREGGGISTAVGGLVDTSRAAGIRTRVVSFDGHWRRQRGTTPRQRNDADVWRVAAKGDLRGVQAFAQAAPPDIVCCHHALLWPLARELAEPAGARTVFVAHVLQAGQDALRGLETPTRSARLEAQALTEADVVITPSKFAAETLRRGHGRERDIKVCPPGLELPMVIQTASQRTSHGPRVAIPGRLDALKGSERVVALLGPLLQAAPTVQVLLIGGLRDNPRAEARWRERFVGAAGAHADRLTMTGWLPRAEALRALQRCDVALFPSKLETLGLAALEAAALGLGTLVGEGPARGLAPLPPNLRAVDRPDDPIAWSDTTLSALEDRSDCGRSPWSAAERAAVSWQQRWPVWARYVG